MAKDRNFLRVSNDNLHLLDIFSDNRYIELGNIDYEIMIRILNKRTTRVDDFLDFTMLEKGIGSSKVSNKELKSHLPFLNLLNIQEKSQNAQLFLTYGLLVSRNEENKEIFSPILLIPVHVFFENKSLLIKSMGKVIENRILLQHLRDMNLDLNLNEKLGNIYSLDKYCLQFTKYNFDVKIENYLTYATLTQPPILVSHDRFGFKNKPYVDFGSKYYIDDESELYHITKLNSRQRLAVSRAHGGASFGLVGTIGTGKTTTLINIASDAIAQNKKVLFVSNKSHTLRSVEEEFASRGLRHLVTNLTVRSRYNKDKSVVQEEVKNIREIKKELMAAYKELDKYETYLAGRIHNFRYLDVLKKVIMLDKPDETFEMDNLDEIYKAEYEEIIESLRTIDGAVKNCPKFKESKFINIPINHSIKYPNQIITLLFQLHKLFEELQEQKVKLETDFGFKTIPNFARFKNVVTNFRGLDPSKVPSAWQDLSANHFEEAKKQYATLKAQVYAFQEAEMYLDWDFTNLESINIDDCIRAVMGSYFQEDDVAKINHIIHTHMDLMGKVKGAVYNHKLFSKSIRNLKKLFNWDFDEHDDQVIDCLLQLTEFLNFNIYHQTWLVQNKQDGIRKEINQLQEDLSHFIVLEKQYFKFFSSYSEIDKNIDYLRKVNASGKTPMKFRNVDLDKLLADFAEYKDLKGKVKKLHKRYIDLTGFEYSPVYDVLVDFDRCTSFINSIEDVDIQRRFVRLLSSSSEADLEIPLQDLNYFKRSHTIISQIYDYVSEFFTTPKDLTSFGKAEYLLGINEYLHQVKITNNLMSEVVKNKEKLIGFETYQNLCERLRKLEEIKKEIRHNKVYKTIYGQIYQKERTNVNELGAILTAYEEYRSLFIEDASTVASMEQQRYDLICADINKTSNIIYEVNETLKLYSKIFKDGIGSYYYDDFTEVIAHLDDLLHAKDELITYLEITDGLKVLNKYKLYVVVNHITSDRTKGLLEYFEFAYFYNLYRLYRMRNPEMMDEATRARTLEVIVNLENQLILSHLYELQSSRKDSNINKSFIDVSKPLTLTTTPILNTYLDLEDFDLVLIDDAHLLNANEYYKAISGKQVILAGEEFSPTSYAVDLLSRMRSNNLMQLHYRYSETPIRLLAELDKTEGVFLAKVSDNEGIEVLSRDPITYLCELFLENKELVINYFTNHFDIKIKINESISEILSNNGVLNEEIYKIIHRQLNVSDLFKGYCFNADYNILDVSEYKNLSLDYFTINHLQVLIACRKKLILIDNEQLLRNPGEDVFLQTLSKLVETKHEVFNPVVNEVLLKLGVLLNHRGIIVHGAYHELSLVVEYNNLYYGIILFSNLDGGHVNILEEYREYYKNFRANKIRVFILWAEDLVDRFEEIGNKIAEDIVS